MGVPLGDAGVSTPRRLADNDVAAARDFIDHG